MFLEQKLRKLKKPFYHFASLHFTSQTCQNEPSTESFFSLFSSRIT